MRIKEGMVLSVGLFLALVGCGGFWMSMQALGGAMEASDLSQRIASRIAAGFDPIYQVMWIEHECKGVFSKVREAAFPAMCPPVIHIWRSGSWDKSIRKVESKHGQIGLRLIEERGPLEKELSIYWEPEIKK